jgi:acyl-homoserine-lactone acylase
VIRVRQEDGSLREEMLSIRRTVHGPVVLDHDRTTIAPRVAALDRARMFEQFWKMGLAHNLTRFQDVMRMQQLPLFNTAYADRDGHIICTMLRRPGAREGLPVLVRRGAGDQSALIWSNIHPYQDLPKVPPPMMTTSAVWVTPGGTP